MNSTNTNDEIIGLEKKYWKAMTDHDLDTALSLTDFPCIVASSHGARSVDREAFTQMFNAHKEDVKSITIGQRPQVRMLNDQTAVVAYDVRFKVEMNGESRDMNAIDTSTWIKRDGRWLCAMHTEIEATKPNEKAN